MTASLTVWMGFLCAFVANANRLGKCTDVILYMLVVIVFMPSWACAILCFEILFRCNYMKTFSTFVWKPGGSVVPRCFKKRNTRGIFNNNARFVNLHGVTIFTAHAQLSILPVHKSHGSPELVLI